MIYLLEDDESIRKYVLYALSQTGFEAAGFERPSAFYAALEKEIPELVLLDVMLPEEDGISVLKQIKETPETAGVPVIMLTAKTTEYDRVVGLDAGADDYIPKPFGTMELISRIRAVLRRCAPQKDTVLRFGALSIDREKHLVRTAEGPAALTKKEFELLCLLAENPGTVFTRDRLLERIWGYDYDGENRTVDVHIRTLRAKLGSCGELVETVRGVGYKIGAHE